MKATTLPTIGWAQNQRMQRGHRAKAIAKQWMSGLVAALVIIAAYGVVDLNDRLADAEARVRVADRHTAQAGTLWRQCIDANDPTIQRLTQGGKSARKVTR